MSKRKKSQTQLEAEIQQSHEQSEKNEENPLIKVKSSINYPEIKILKDGSIKVLDTYNNLKYLLERFDAEIRFNIMSRRREIIIPSIKFFNDDRENNELSKIEALAILNGMPNRNIDKWLEVIASENAYHPIVELLNNNPWDGISRLDDLIKTFKPKHPELAKKLLITWMISTIQMAHNEGNYTAHGVLVIQGPQGIGKTAWVKRLDPIGNTVKTGALLDPTNKDSVIAVNRFFIVELGELDATLNKTDISRLKSYITSLIDDIRVPYGRKETRFIRRTTFIATVNDSNFLVDPTGNRRWWTISTDSINYEHDINIIQLWAEIKYLWKHGERSYLTVEEQKELNLINEEHEKIDPFQEKLLARFDWENPLKIEMSSCAILKILGYDKPSPNEVKRMAQILQKQNRKPGRKNSRGNMIHEVPATYTTDINF